MKVCPSCNARASDDASSCPSCDHEFDVGRGKQKETMMGFPHVGGDDGDGGGDAKATHFGMPALDDDEEQDQGQPEPPSLQTEVVSSEELPIGPEDFAEELEEKGGEDGATAQVDSSAVADALSKATGGDSKGTAFGLPSVGDEESEESQEDEAASAWGLDENTEAEGDSATAVVSPAELDFGETPEWYGDDNDAGAAEVQESEEEEERQDSRFGTLMGMSLEEDTGDESAAGAMHQGAAGDEEPDQETDGSTQALSPEQLAQIDQMSFDEEGDDEEPPSEIEMEGTGGGNRLRPGREHHATPVADVDAGAAAEDAAPSTPAQSSSASAPKAGKQEDGAGDEQKKSSIRPSQDTAPSGVLRPAKKRKKRSDSMPPESSGPSTDRMKESGVTGTGTYSSTGRDTDQTGGDGPSTIDELKLGGVGSGADTSFQTGGEREPVAERASQAGPGGAEEPASSGAVANRDPGSAGAGQTGQSSPAEQEGDADEGSLLGDISLDDIEMSWDESEEEDEAVAASPSDDASTQTDVVSEAPTEEGTAFDLDRSSPEPETGSPQELEPEPVSPQELEPEPVSPQQSGPQAQQPSQPAQQSAPQAQQPSQPAQQSAPQPQQPQQPPQSAPQQPPQSASQPQQPPQSTPQPQQPPQQSASQPQQPPQSAPQPQQPPQSAPQPSGNAPDFGASSAPVPMEQNAEAAEEQASKDDDALAEFGGVDRVISLIQKGFGLLAAVVMLIMTAVAVIMGGLPDDGAGLAVTGASAVLALAVGALTVVPISTTMQSVGFAMIAIVALLGFGAGLAVGLGELMLISLFAGGLMLLCAAAFPRLGKAVMKNTP